MTKASLLPGRPKTWRIKETVPSVLRKIGTSLHQADPVAKAGEVLDTIFSAMTADEASAFEKALGEANSASGAMPLPLNASKEEKEDQERQAKKREELRAVVREKAKAALKAAKIKFEVVERKGFRDEAYHFVFRGTHYKLLADWGGLHVTPYELDKNKNERPVTFRHDIAAGWNGRAVQLPNGSFLQRHGTTLEFSAGSVIGKPSSREYLARIGNPARPNEGYDDIDREIGKRLGELFQGDFSGSASVGLRSKRFLR